MLTRTTNLILIAVLVGPTIPPRADCGCGQQLDATSGQTDCCSAKPTPSATTTARDCCKKVPAEQAGCGFDMTCCCSPTQRCQCGDDCRCGGTENEPPVPPVPPPNSTDSDEFVRLLTILGLVSVDVPLSSTSANSYSIEPIARPTAQQVCAQLNRFLL